uniref:Ig-like domain-containing protein n=1 Tax=Pundamilia nyererei TaxID=303518 RepID=A0A3B4GYQ1_9CICH
LSIWMVFVTVVVSEGSDAILPCSLSTNQNLEYLLFDWRKKAPNKQEVFMYDGGIHYNNGRPGQDEQFRGRVSHFPQELQFGNASIIIRNTRLADSGVYTCDFPHLQLEGKTFRIKLDVEFLNKTILLAAIIDHLKISGSPGASHTIGPTFTECIVVIRLYTVCLQACCCTTYYGKKTLTLMLTNYRPISKLPFISKILEKVVLRQLQT